MPKMHINKSIVIDAPVDKIYQSLINFNEWTSWSPWLIMDPDAKVTVAEDQQSYEWEGGRVGSGNMSILSHEENKWIDYTLNFLKPWKSTADVRFEFHSEGDSVRVHWLMNSSLPFFLFWMKKMMTAFVGMDYERGLRMLKERIEDGTVKSKLEFKGESDFPATKYVGVNTTCTISGMAEAMGADFTKLESFAGDLQDVLSGAALSIYHKFDIVKDQVNYTAALPVSSVPSGLGSDFTSGEIPATKIHTVRHVGAYHHLGNAWTTLMNMQRSKEFKPKKGIHPFELYVNDPREVSDSELITDINFAVK